jgi:hypothetical protein
MSSDVEAFVTRRIVEAPIVRSPFPHCVIDDVFPADFFEAIIDHWPEEESWISLAATGRAYGRGTNERMTVLLEEGALARLDAARREFWQKEVSGWLLGRRFRAALLEKFARELAEAGFGAEVDGTSGDALIVSDRTNYAIGPHTDSPARVVSLLFYLPEDAAFRRYGTSFYQPLDAALRSRGGPHLPFELFRKAKTVEFLPNRLVTFPKSDRCFHGVEPVDLPGIDRRLLIYDVRRTSPETRSITSLQSP